MERGDRRHLVSAVTARYQLPVRVVGVDPGGSTGLATVEWDPVTGYVLHNRGVLVEATPAQVCAHVAALAPQVVAIERFVVSRRSGRSKTAGAGERARNIIGAIMARFPTLYTNTAADAKGWATDARLAAAGFGPFGSPHSRDAARHALFVIVKAGWGPDPMSATYDPPLRKV